MNLFEKIQTVRTRLNACALKKSGKNTFAGYEYFELTDYTKALNEIMAELKMTAICSFNREIASLTAINSENPEETYTITSPFGSAELKGCHEVQNIGAVETYQRRYLYQAMFDIAENDSLDSTQGRKDRVDKPVAKPTSKPAVKPSNKPLTLEEAKEKTFVSKGITYRVGDLPIDKLEVMAKFDKMPEIAAACHMVLDSIIAQNEV